ncbi:MAG: hypothetical protein J5779_02380, partial [Clostridia bacterium]|nr:hypothetical protein [Clostridia bacterium]
TIEIDKNITLKFITNSNITRFNKNFGNFFNITKDGSLTIDANGFSVQFDGGIEAADLDEIHDFSMFNNSGELVLCGITIKNNASIMGAGVKSFGNTTLQNCTLKNLFSTYGGAASVLDGHIKILGGEFKENVAPDGRAKDLYLATESNPETDEISCLFSSQNQISIFSEQSLVIGENFIVASSSTVVLNQNQNKSTLFVKSSPAATKINLKVNNLENNQKIVEFLGLQEPNLTLFDLQNKGYRLKLSGNCLYAEYVEVMCDVTFVLAENNQTLLQKQIKSGLTISQADFENAISDVEIPAGHHIVFKDEFKNIFDSTKQIDDNTTIFVYLEPDILKVEFYVENELITELNVEYGNALKAEEIPAIPQKQNQDASAYWLLRGETEEFDFNLPITENLVLDAHYFINTYKVTFTLKYLKDFGQALEFTQSKQITKESGYELSAKDLPEFENKLGYNGESEWENLNTTVNEDIEIFGVLQKDVLAVQFFVDSTQQGETQHVEYGKTIAEISIPQIPTKEGYTQTEPYWVRDGQASAFDFNSPITENLTLVARYSQNVYNVTFVLPDKTEITKQVLHGETVSTEGVIEKSFGEIVSYSSSLENITEDQTIYVSKTNALLWSFIASFGALTIVAVIFIIKLIKKKKISSFAKSNKGKNKKLF